MQHNSIQHTLTICEERRSSSSNKYIDEYLRRARILSDIVALAGAQRTYSGDWLHSGGPHALVDTLLHARN